MSGMSGQYFERMYDADPDPWGFETRWYERRKYALTLSMLPDEHYRSAFEPGCSIGVLTELLASRCDHVLSTDIAEAPLRRARERGIANATFRRESLHDGWPDGRFALVVLSEMCYYFDPFDLDRLASSAVSATEPGGAVCIAHWRHDVPEYPSTADQVHTAFGSASGMTIVAQYRDDDVLIDVFRVDS
ncbi:class I SAM-dependent DNA methyltransferase [Rhodococcus sp. MEB064]|uniref:class I SAM-dependent DNA methyltransferase n=1 Tax=Rhodococcus sp. MEB064 TaxID=1587522 RepID=UPI0005ACF4BD|nr:class I SAM-dependent methyltransferase [Rhodococcus sp. MEB064]KIQ17561.1 hypothetical protein RU01_10440 [Rhodococcus sp. MEB064]